MFCKARGYEKAVRFDKGACLIPEYSIGSVRVKINQPNEPSLNPIHTRLHTQTEPNVTEPSMYLLQNVLNPNPTHDCFSFITCGK